MWRTGLVRASNDFVSISVCLLARSHLRSGHRAKIEASYIVQQTLLQAHVQRAHFRGESDGELAA
jgi:hypothetical protein